MFDGYTEVVAPPPLLTALAPNALRGCTAKCPPGGLLADLLDEGRVMAEYPDAPTTWTPDGSERGVAAEGAMIERTAGWDHLTAWSEASKMREISAAVDRAVERARCRPDTERLWSVEMAVDSLVHEFALAWRVASRTAQHRVDEAVNLVQGAPLVVSAMIRGDITLAHARALADVLLRLGRDLADRVAREVLDENAPARTPAQLAAKARRVALQMDPDAAVKRHRAARQERGVDLKADEDGMATITAYLPAAEALALYRTVDAHARRSPASGPDGETRSMDARRADSLVDLVASGALLAAGAQPSPERADPEPPNPDSDAPCRCADGSPHTDATISATSGVTDETPASTTGVGEARPTSGTADPSDDHAPSDHAHSDHAPSDPGRPDTGRSDSDRPHTARRSAAPDRPGPRSPVHVEVRVVVGADTLLGVDDAPGELVGHGPITAGEARRLAAGSDATWRRILTDPASGTVLDVGHTRYRPPPSLAEHVRSRDVTCYFPGCRVPASACDLDHVVPFDPDARTGPTSAANLRPPCRHHHRVKQLPGWTVRPVGDDAAEWTTPSGHRYRTARSPLIPITVIPDRPRPAGRSAADQSTADWTPEPEPIPF